ncbi:hypothetical protein BOTBODRAFT_27643 [Botryobasidium botryosum FD-172 SS1]|uniref:Uncharacterized protein n=1 Tax=Botryobasidium botryosum (strain FD-172 SS1) TaxID=930990 RepID=A0A067MX80_BOTB1|nr:hypothetical protein BOTBODRAFT_27643 [Botryobasidium botryosum FD-172 SS1]
MSPDFLFAERDALDLKDLVRYNSMQDLDSIPLEILTILASVIARKNLFEEDIAYSEWYARVLSEQAQQYLCLRTDGLNYYSQLSETLPAPTVIESRKRSGSTLSHSQPSEPGTAPPPPNPPRSREQVPLAPINVPPNGATTPANGSHYSTRPPYDLPNQVPLPAQAVWMNTHPPVTPWRQDLPFNSFQPPQFATAPSQPQPWVGLQPVRQPQPQPAASNEERISPRAKRREAAKLQQRVTEEERAKERRVLREEAASTERGKSKKRDAGLSDEKVLEASTSKPGKPFVGGIVDDRDSKSDEAMGTSSFTYPATDTTSSSTPPTSSKVTKTRRPALSIDPFHNLPPTPPTAPSDWHTNNIDPETPAYDASTKTIRDDDGSTEMPSRSSKETIIRTSSNVCSPQPVKFPLPRQSPRPSSLPHFKSSPLSRPPSLPRIATPDPPAPDDTGRPSSAISTIRETSRDPESGSPIFAQSSLQPVDKNTVSSLLRGVGSHANSRPLPLPPQDAPSAIVTSRITSTGPSPSSPLPSPGNYSKMPISPLNASPISTSRSLSALTKSRRRVDIHSLFQGEGTSLGASISLDKPPPAQSSPSQILAPSERGSGSAQSRSVSAIPEFVPKPRSAIKITTPTGIPVDLDKIRREAQVKAAAAAAATTAPVEDEVDKTLRMLEEQLITREAAKLKVRQESKKKKDRRAKEGLRQATKPKALETGTTNDDEIASSSAGSPSPSR